MSDEHPTYPDPSKPDPDALVGNQEPAHWTAARIGAELDMVLGAFDDPPRCDEHGQKMRLVHLAGADGRIVVGFDHGNDCPPAGAGEIFIAGA